MSRISRKKKTVEVMIDLFCLTQKHSIIPNQLCHTCSELLCYTHERLDKCIFGDEKPTCAQCPIHCYRPDRKAEISEIMCYSGRRMLLKHPLLAVCHLLDGTKKPSKKILFYQTKKIKSGETNGS